MVARCGLRWVLLGTLFFLFAFHEGLEVEVVLRLQVVVVTFGPDVVRIVPPSLVVIVASLMILIRRHISMLTCMSVLMMSRVVCTVGMPSLPFKLITWSIVLAVVLIASVTRVMMV